MLLVAPNSRVAPLYELATLRQAFTDNALAFVLFNVAGLLRMLLCAVAWPALRSERHRVCGWVCV